MKRVYLLLVFILIVASFLRLWKLGSVPISPDWDEAALAYNAYSIAQTGKDEYGKFLPVVLRSFDDYKPAGYAYLAIPSVSVLGLTTEAVRLPSSIFGMLTVGATFFLVRKLLKRDDIALASAFFLAVSPWHIQFSRIAFEANVGVAFNILGVLFFLYGLRKPPFLFLSSIFLGLGIYIYQAEKVFVPLLIGIMVFVFRSEILKIKLKAILAGVLLFLVVLPMLIYLITNQDSLRRAQGVSVFSEQITHSQAQKFLEDKEKRDILGLVFDNRRVVYAKRVIEGYISHFDLNWLFIKGDLARHHAPFMGLLYMFELPFLILGLYFIVFGPFHKKAKAFIVLWILIAPIPASVTSGVPHAVRTLNFLPMPQILTAIGFVWAVSKLLTFNYRVLSIRLKYLILFFVLSSSIFNFIYYLNQYFSQQNYYTAKDWQYGYKEIMPELKRIFANFDKIVVSNQPPMDQSYMFFLFYLKYDPSEYQKYGETASGGFRETHEFGKFEFRPITWSNEERDGKTLFIGRPSDFSGGEKEIFTVSYPDKSPAIRMVR